jgi:hypothetical protein
MDWQDVGVWIVVAAAALFLISRNVNLRRRRNQPAQSFVPLSSLRRPGGAVAEPQPDDPHCH